MADNVPLSKYINLSMVSKVCRLCGGKDGPYLNIFGPETDLAKKIKESLQIVIEEFDDLPHKICFRCSAKVEDFYEFLKKCLKTQENFVKVSGKNLNLRKEKVNKIKNSWEEKLNKNQLSNDAYCDELVMKAMQSVAALTKSCPSSPLTSPFIMDKIRAKHTKVKLMRVDQPGYPGVEIRNGKFFVLPIEVNNRKNVTPSEDISESAENSKFHSLKDNLNKLQTDINKKVANEINISNVKSSQEIASNKPNIRPAKVNSVYEDMVVPDSFSIVKVTGIGAIVYTCKFCHHSILEKNRVFNHKCQPLRQRIQKSVPLGTKIVNQDRKSLSKSLLQSTVTATQLGTSIVASLTSIEETQRTNKTPTTDCTPLQAHQTGKNVATDSICQPNEIDVTPSSTNHSSGAHQGIQPINVHPGVSQSSLIDGNILLMPMGNNVYSLQIQPQYSNIPSAINNSNLASTSQANYNHSVVPNSNKITSNIISSPLNPSPISNHFDDSILPHSNNCPVTSPQINDQSHQLNNQQPIEKIVLAKRKVIDANSLNLPKRKKSKISKKMNGNKSDISKAPYPVGLLCRNSNKKNESNTKQASSEKVIRDDSVLPEYTILPTKTPGKICISTVASSSKMSTSPKVYRKVPNKEVENLERKDVSKKIKQESAEQASEHFFTYVNLDPMLKPSYVLPSYAPIQSTDILEAANIPTTVVPVTFEKPEEKESSKHVCSICDLEFTRETKLLAHVKSHFESLVWPTAPLSGL